LKKLKKRLPFSAKRYLKMKHLLGKKITNHG
jgi:hypothetical protein